MERLAAIGRPALRSPTLLPCLTARGPVEWCPQPRALCPRPLTNALAARGHPHVGPEKQLPRAPLPLHRRSSPSFSLSRSCAALPTIVQGPADSATPARLSTQRCRYPQSGRDLEPGLSGDSITLFLHQPYAIRHPRACSRQALQNRPPKKFTRPSGLILSRPQISSSHPTFF